MSRTVIVPRRWRLDSGHVSLDFVNTRQGRWRGGVEQLTTPGDLADWLRAAGVASAASQVSAANLAAAIALRESINALVEAVIAGCPAPSGSIDELNRWLGSKTRADAELALDAARRPLLLRRLRGDEAVAAALRVLALEAASVLGTDQRERLRVCGDEQCSMRFLDRSNASSRRWCSTRCCTRHHMRERRRRDSRGQAE